MEILKTIDKFNSQKYLFHMEMWHLFFRVRKASQAHLDQKENQGTWFVQTYFMAF